MKPLKDITGLVSGKLTVLYRLPHTSKKVTRWMCQCECGNTKDVLTSHLVRKAIKSCGCTNIARIIARNKALIDRETHNRTWYRVYKRKAAKRGIEFNLTEQEFHDIASLPCFYCGKAPFNRTHDRLGGARPVSGVDRVDNTKGYLPGNCRPCCKHCNYAKHQLTEDDFRELVRRIYMNWVNDA